MEKLLVTIIFLQIGILNAKGYTWGYTGYYGPSHWPELFKECGGKRQSPINIDTDTVEVEHYQPFNFDNYNVPLERMRLTNNGHTAKINMESTVARKIRQGGLKGDYIFFGIYFHWGSNSAQGSGHTINGVRYPLEMRIKSYKESYRSVGEAIKYGDGLAPLSVLFEVGETDNEAFTPIVQGLADITDAGMVTEVSSPYSLQALLPDDTDKFYRYVGSLPTPTCNEALIWTVFNQTVRISEKQLKAFRVLKDEGGRELVDNYRPTQPLHGRKVFVRSTDTPPSSNSLEVMIFAVFFIATAAVAVIVKIF